MKKLVKNIIAFLKKKKKKSNNGVICMVASKMVLLVAWPQYRNYISLFSPLLLFHTELISRTILMESIVQYLTKARDICDPYPGIWRRIFQGWSKFANPECNYWFCFVYKQIWGTTLFLWIHEGLSLYS